MLILLLLVDTFVPLDVSEYITKQSFTLMDFNIVPIVEIPYVNYPTELLDYAQENEVLNDLGLEWRSTFNNMYSFILTLLLIMLFHGLLASTKGC